MHRVIGLSENFTAALREQQAGLRAELQALAKRVNEEISASLTEANVRATGLRDFGSAIAVEIRSGIAKTQDEYDARRLRLEALLSEILDLEARIADGNDDGAKAVAEALKANPVHPATPPTKYAEDDF